MTVIDLTQRRQPVLVGEPVDRRHRAARHRDHAERHVCVRRAIHTTGDVTVVDLATLEIVRSIQTGGNPQAVVITNDGDNDELDERVYVTRMFGELIDPARPGRLRRRQAGRRSTRFTVGAAVDGDGAGRADQRWRRSLRASTPIAGSSARTRATRSKATEVVAGQGRSIFFNSGANGDRSMSTTSWRTRRSARTSTRRTLRSGGAIGKVAQKVYPNMLFSALVRGRRAVRAERRRVARAAGPLQRQRAGPGRRDRSHPGRRRRWRTRTCRSTSTRRSRRKRSRRRPTRGTRSIELFLNDLVAVDADRAGRNFLFVSRGGNYVLRAGLDATGKLNILDARRDRPRRSACRPATCRPAS